MSGEPLVSFVVGGDPRGKGRPRFRIIRPKGGGSSFASVYTDSATLEWERCIAQAGAAAWSRPPLDVALTVLVEAYLAIPVSWPKRKQAQAVAGDVVPMGVPDGDNIFKCVGDSCNKIIWVDDSIIINSQCLKLYSEWPRLRISVWRWHDILVAEPELI